MPVDLFLASELHYNTDESFYEDDDPRPDQHEEEQEDGDDQVVPLWRPPRLRSSAPSRRPPRLRIPPHLRSSSPLRSWSPLNWSLSTIEEEDDEEGPLRSSTPVRSWSPLNWSLSSIEDDDEEDEAALRSLPRVNRFFQSIEDEDEAPLRSLSPSFIAASLPHSDLNRTDRVLRQANAVGFVRDPVQSRGVRRRRDEEDDDQEVPANRRHRANPVEEP